MSYQNSIYQFLTGPALWTTFTIFLGGLIVRIVYLFRLSQKKDRVIYNHAALSWGMKSIFIWLVPFGSASMRQQPAFTIMVFVFHATLLAVPLCHNAHTVLWDEA